MRRGNAFSLRKSLPSSLSRRVRQTTNYTVYCMIWRACHIYLFGICLPDTSVFGSLILKTTARFPCIAFVCCGNKWSFVRLLHLSSYSSSSHSFTDCYTMCRKVLGHSDWEMTLCCTIFQSHSAGIVMTVEKCCATTVRIFHWLRLSSYWPPLERMNTFLDWSCGRRGRQEPRGTCGNLWKKRVCVCEIEQRDNDE